MKNIFVYIIPFFFFTLCSFPETLTTFSPDNNIVIKFKTDDNGSAFYQVSHNNNFFLNWSKLGLNFNGFSLTTGLKIIKTEQKIIDETYPVIAGKTRYSRNHCSETKVTLQQISFPNRILEIYLRAYNDGAAFRYIIPNQNTFADFTLNSEETQFNFAGDYACWALKMNRYNTSYEGDYRKYQFSNLFNSKDDPFINNNLVTLPLTVKAGADMYVCLSEANITNYSGMYLVKGGLRNSFISSLSPHHNQSGTSVYGTTPFLTPWRVFIIGNSAGDLIESNLIMNLNEPCKIANTSWIKPGRSLWEWWSGASGFSESFGWGLNDKTYRYYIDFAAANGIEYVTIDAGWYGSLDASKSGLKNDINKSIPGLNIESLADYANSKGVGLFVWVLWYQLQEQLEEAMSYYERIGLKGLKIDFMERDDQDMVNFYHSVLESAARHKQLINFHGAYKPDGYRRTYPNLITREAVLGNEYSKGVQDLPNPNYNVTIPFTRMVTGPMDYTPGSMITSSKEKYKPDWNRPSPMGTRLHQMAMLIVYESGLQTLCESPKVYEGLKEFNFIKRIPATWDTTIVLGGEIGEYIIIARKRNDTLYVGAMTNWNEREVEIDYSFLGKENFIAEVYSDGDDANVNPNSTKYYKDFISNKNIKKYHLSKGGGLGIIIYKQ